MTRRYYNPEYRFSPISNVLEQILQRENNQKNEKNRFSPGIDIAETDKHFVIRLTVPGIKKEDIKIELHENKLRISGERKTIDGDVSIKYHKLQTAYGSFSESFTLPDNVDKESIHAKQEDGVLSISIHKLEKKEKKSIIEVK